ATGTLHTAILSEHSAPPACMPEVVRGALCSLKIAVCSVPVAAPIGHTSTPLGVDVLATGTRAGTGSFAKIGLTAAAVCREAVIGAVASYTYHPASASSAPQTHERAHCNTSGVPPLRNGFMGVMIPAGSST
ncbi:MAG: hypothetical protein KBE09_05565, partial [Candidatus Pacebacteria bacterium]|nr:hypothetical protein [Candidatus Paceibacterota bacterium]